MQSQYSKLLFLSILAVIAAIFGGTLGKSLGVGLGMWMIYKREVAYFPLIVLITAFLSTAHVLYIQMFLICIFHVKMIKDAKMITPFRIFTLVMIVFLGLVLYLFFTTDKNLGTSINRFSFLLAFAPFFYTMVLLKRDITEVFYKRLYLIFLLIMILNAAFSFISDGYITTRMIFFIIPFLIIQIILNIKKIKNLRIILSSIVVLLISLSGLTFTLILTAVVSYFLAIQKLSRFRVVSVVLVLIIVLIPIYSIQNKDRMDFTAYSEIKMDDISSFEDLKGRAGMKLFEDRGPLWFAAWTYISSEASLYPSFDEYELVIESKSNKEQAWEHHVHNLFLESMLRLGIILGVTVMVAFLYINLKGYRVLSITGLNLFEKSFFATAFSVNIIGAMTGIFPLLFDFSFLGLGVFGLYKLNTSS